MCDLNEMNSITQSLTSTISSMMLKKSLQSKNTDVWRFVFFVI